MHNTYTTTYRIKNTHIKKNWRPLKVSNMERKCKIYIDEFSNILVYKSNHNIFLGDWPSNDLEKHFQKSNERFNISWYQTCKRSAKYRLTNFQTFWYINQITTSFWGDWPSNDLEKHCQKSNERFKISWCHCKTNKPYKCLTCWEWICCEWLCLINRDFTQKITIFFLFN